MRFLLDTRAFLWFVQEDPRLSAKARGFIEDDDNERLLSPASYWEIAIKVGIGKLNLATPLATFLADAIRANRVLILPEHAVAVSQLPHHHRDPFGRMLVAQALVEDLPILSADPALDAYNVPRLWA